MAVKFNPFTGQLQIDQVGAGGGGGASYIDGEVATYNDLPLDGTAALNSAWLVRTASGVWPVSRKQAGIYIRTATAGSSRDADYTYAGTMPDVFSDANFTIYDDADTSKNLKFQLSGLATGTTSTLTVPASGTIARTSDIPSTFAASAITSGVFDNARVNFAAPSAIGSTTPAAGSFTTLSASDIVTPANSSAAPPTTTSAAKGIQFTSLGGGTNQVAAYGSYAGTPTFGIGAGTGAGSLTEIAAFNLNGVTLNRALTVGNGTLTASAPVLSLSQTWNNAATTFTGLQFDVTNTASATSSLVARFTVGSTNVFETDVRGFTTLRKVATTTDFVNMFIIRRGTTEVFAVRDDGATNATAFFCPASGAGHSSMNADGFAVRSSGSFRISSDAAAFSPDVFLRRDAAGVFAQYNGTNVQEYRLYGTFTSSTNYQRMTVKSARQTLSALSGASATTTGTFIPDGAVVVGVTTRVATLLTGATGYTIGDGTDADRWGDITGTAIGTTSDNRDWTAGTIECFTAGGNITLTAKTSNFTAGAIEICVFYLAGEAD